MCRSCNFAARDCSKLADAHGQGSMISAHMCYNLICTRMSCVDDAGLYMCCAPAISYVRLVPVFGVRRVCAFATQVVCNKRARRSCAQRSRLPAMPRIGLLGKSCERDASHSSTAPEHDLNQSYRGAASQPLDLLPAALARH